MRTIIESPMLDNGQSQFDFSLNHNFHLLIAQESNEEEEQENNAFATLPTIFQ